jgi:hypothetical protein
MQQSISSLDLVVYWVHDYKQIRAAAALTVVSFRFGHIQSLEGCRCVKASFVLYDGRLESFWLRLQITFGSGYADAERLFIVDIISLSGLNLTAATG